MMADARKIHYPYSSQEINELLGKTTDKSGKATDWQKVQQEWNYRLDRFKAMVSDLPDQEVKDKTAEMVKLAREAAYPYSPWEIVSLLRFNAGNGKPDPDTGLKEFERRVALYQKSDIGRVTDILGADPEEIRRWPISKDQADYLVNQQDYAAKMADYARAKHYPLLSDEISEIVMTVNEFQDQYLELYHRVAAYTGEPMIDVTKALSLQAEPPPPVEPPSRIESQP